VTAVVLLGDIVERSTQRYLVNEVLNMWEVSMGGSHIIILWLSTLCNLCISPCLHNACKLCSDGSRRVIAAVAVTGGFVYGWIHYQLLYKEKIHFINNHGTVD
jgi:hypothetical protein